MAQKWAALAALAGHEILAENDGGYVHRDPVFPDRFVRVEGCKEGDDYPGHVLPFNCASADDLRMWAATMVEAADKIEGKWNKT